MVGEVGSFGKHSISGCNVVSRMTFLHTDQVMVLYKLSCVVSYSMRNSPKSGHDSTVVDWIRVLEIPLESRSASKDIATPHSLATL